MINHILYTIQRIIFKEIHNNHPPTWKYIWMECGKVLIWTVQTQTNFSHWTSKWQHSDDDNQDVSSKVSAGAELKTFQGKFVQLRWINSSTNNQCRIDSLCKIHEVLQVKQWNKTGFTLFCLLAYFVWFLIGLYIKENRKKILAMINKVLIKEEPWGKRLYN